MPDFSIIIVTWNALHHLKTFLPVVWEHSRDEAEIIIADNASSDGTAAWVAGAFPDIRIVALERNYGYCGGNNRAALHARTNTLIFLNNDAGVSSGWLGPLRDMLENDPVVAAVQPKIMSWKEPDHFEYAGAAGGVLDRHAYPFCRGRIFDTLEKDTGQYDSPCDISWASGAALVIRKDIFLDLGGFDESFEFHMEEIDLCWRLWNEGYRVRFCPLSKVYHLGGGSLPADSPKKLYYNYRNNLKMIFKNSVSRKLVPRLFMRWMLDGIAFSRSLAGLRFRECGAIMRAHLHFYASIPELIRSRRDLAARRSTLSDDNVLQPFSIIWHYFFRGRRKFRELPVRDLSGMAS